MTKKKKISRKKTSLHKHQYIFLEYKDPELSSHTRTTIEYCLGCKNLKGIKAK